MGGILLPSSISIPMIKLENVSKKFSGKVVVDGVNLSIGMGEVIGFLGPNGAGKTTTMRLIIGYLARTEGVILVEGEDPGEEGRAVREKIGYLPENNPLYYDLKTSEYLNFIARIKTAEKPKHENSLVDEVIEVCGLKEVYNRLTGELSRGFKQRVGLAAAIIGNPKILILYEPTSSLDPNQIVEIRRLIKELGKNKTIILTTHIIPEVLQTCSRVVVIDKGRIVADKEAASFGGEDEFYKLTKEKQM